MIFNRKYHAACLIGLLLQNNCMQIVCCDLNEKWMKMNGNKIEHTQNNDDDDDDDDSDIG